MVLKKCEPELSNIQAELFYIFLRESCFLDRWKVLLVVPAFNNVGERSTAKSNCPAGLSAISKIFENLLNNRLVDHLQKWGLFSDSQYYFRSSQSIADLSTVVSDRIARAFKKSGAS